MSEGKRGLASAPGGLEAAALVGTVEDGLGTPSKEDEEGGEAEHHARVHVGGDRLHACTRAGCLVLWKGLLLKGLLLKGLLWKGLLWKGLLWKGLLCKGLLWKGLLCKGLLCKGLLCKGLLWKGQLRKGL